MEDETRVDLVQRLAEAVSANFEGNTGVFISYTVDITDIVMTLKHLPKISSTKKGNLLGSSIDYRDVLIDFTFDAGPEYNHVIPDAVSRIVEYSGSAKGLYNIRILAKMTSGRHKASTLREATQYPAPLTKDDLTKYDSFLEQAMHYCLGNFSKAT